MKILLLNQTFFPDHMATAQQVTDLATFLVGEGHTVSVISGQRGYENRAWVYPARETFRGIEIHRVRSTGFGKRRFILRLLDAITFDLMLLLKLFLFPSQDVVVSFTSPPLIGVLGNFFCWLKGGQSVQWMMDINPDAAFAVGYLRRKTPVGAFLNWVLEVTLRNCSHVIVLDQWMKQVVLSHGAHAENISIIHPWSVIDPSIEGSEQSLFRQNNHLGNKTLILYSGNHSVVHPLQTLLEAAKLLRSDPDILFVFVGAGLRTKEVAAFKQLHGLKNIVQLPLQPRDLLSDMLSSANAHVVVMGEAVNGLVHTSKVYGALATGKPLVYIGPKKSHLMDLLKESVCGYAVEHGDAQALVQAALNIKALNPAEIKKIEHENKAYLVNQCDMRKCLTTFTREVLKTPGFQQGVQTPPLPTTAA